MDNKEAKPGEEKKKSKKKKGEQVTYNYPPIDYEALKKIPNFTIEVRYAAGKANDNAIVDITIPIDSTLSQVAKIIEEKHNNSLKNLRLYLSKEEASSKQGGLNEYFYKKFNEINFQDDKKIKGGEVIKLYYDFDACQHPLLEANYY